MTRPWFAPIDFARSVHVLRPAGGPRSARAQKAVRPAFADWILHEDSFLIVVDKPAGILSQGSSDRDALDLVSLAREHTGIAQVGVMHRIDRNVSGLVLISKSPRAARHVLDLFARGRVFREYSAIALAQMGGKWRPSQELVIDARLEKDRAHNEVRVSRGSAAGDAAQTEISIDEIDGRIVSVRARPITGRSHQIRVHLAHVGLPIIGDPKYGVAAGRIRRPLLHACAVRLTHPATRKELSFTSPAPFEVSEVTKELRRR